MGRRCAITLSAWLSVTLATIACPAQPEVPSQSAEALESAVNAALLELRAAGDSRNGALAIESLRNALHITDELSALGYRQYATAVRSYRCNWIMRATTYSAFRGEFDAATLQQMVALLSAHPRPTTAQLVERNRINANSLAETFEDAATRELVLSHFEHHRAWALSARSERDLPPCGAVMSALSIPPPGSDAPRTIALDCGEWSALIEDVEHERRTDVLGMAVLRAYAHHAEHGEWPEDPDLVLSAPSPDPNPDSVAYLRSAPGEFPPFSLGIFDLDVNALVWWSVWDEFASELSEEQSRRLDASDLQ